MKKFIAFLKHRGTVFIFAMLLQISIIITLTLFFSKFISSFYIVMLFVGLLLVLRIINSTRNLSFKIAWIVPILLFPIYSGLFYCLIESNSLSKKEKQAINFIGEKVLASNMQNADVMKMLKDKDLCASRQSNYINKYSYCPPYTNTITTYYALGELFFEALKKDLARAEKYIFMEYFIIERGKMWDEILDILVDRIKNGVEVRLIIDDFGCLLRLSSDYMEELEALGIRIAVFNPLKPVMSLRYNTRDHRKITVVDGKVGYTGGCNIADEYINEYNRFGHWKDSAIRLEGDAVWSLTAMFLSLWEFMVGDEEDYNVYRPKYDIKNFPNDTISIVQPFTDEPLDNEHVGVTIYLNMIYKSQKNIYIKTPYLIIDNEIFSALSIAAKSGIDVRIITPGKPDKKIVHLTTRSYYKKLIESGVKIYEYSPGFMHEKVIVVDDRYAVIGTINLDYRSLYLHYECGVWLYNTDSIKEMNDDFINILSTCEEIELKDCMDIPWHVRLMRALFRIFAPLM